MYVRFIEITSASVTQFDMAVAWFKTEWSSLAIKGGASVMTWSSFQIILE